MTQMPFLRLLHADDGVRETAVSQPSPQTWQNILLFAQKHYIAPLLFSKLKPFEAGVPTAVFQTLQQAALLNTGRNLALQHAFHNLTNAFIQANIPLIPLKGIYLAGSVYPSLGDRVIGDLDLLVPRSETARAVAVAEAAGYLPTKPLLLEAWQAENYHSCPQYNKQNRITLELHWHLGRLNGEIRPFWQRAQKTAVFNHPTLTLTPEDTLLHLCYHLAYHHDFLFGVRNLCDIAQLCHRFTVDWNALFARAAALQLARGAFLALQLAKTALGANIPDGVLTMHRPPDYTPRLLTDATAQLLTFPDQYDQISLTRRRVAAAQGWRRAVALKDALLPSKQQMAIRYGTVPQLESRLGRVAFRWRSLGVQAVEKFRKQGKYGRSTQILKRKNKLAAWLREE